MVLVVAVAVLAGCGSGAAGNGTTLTLWARSDESAFIQGVVNGFNRSHPDALQDTGVTDKPFLWMSTPTRALFAVVLMIIWKTVGFQMLLLMTGLQSIPNDVLEAGVVITMVPRILIFLLLQRYYVRGLVAGAVK